MEDILKKLQMAMEGRDVQETEIPYRPEIQEKAPLEEAVSDAQTAQINEQAKSPSMMTKPELVQKEVIQEAMKTPQGQLQKREVASEVENPVSKADEVMKRIKDYEARMNKKPESDWRQNLPDIMAGLHNILNYSQGSRQKNIATDNASKRAKSQADTKKTDLNNISNLRKMYADYQAAQNKGGLTAAQKADHAIRNRGLDIQESTAKRKGVKPTEGDKTLDREFAKKYNEWNLGGKADYEVNSKIFKDAIKGLKKGEVSTGTLDGMGARMPGYRSETREVEDQVRKAINGMLRATLGSQFTEKEGERIFAQTFDPYKSEDANIAAMESELAKLEKRKDAIQEMSGYYKKNRTMSGYSPLEAKTGIEEVQDKRNTVKRQTKDGRTAIFDADTKEFIDYE